VSFVRLTGLERKDWDPAEPSYQCSCEYAHAADRNWFPSFFRVQVVLAVLVLLFMLLLHYDLIPV